MSLCKGWLKTTIPWTPWVNPRQHSLVIMTILMCMPSIGFTQTITVSKIIAASGNLELDSLPTSGGDQVVFIDSTTERIRRRIIARSDLPTPVAYEDEVNTYSLTQTFNGAVSINGTATFATTPVFTWSAPALKFIETGGTTDRQRWQWVADAEHMNLQSLTDSDVVTGYPFRAQHTGSLVLDPFSKQVLPNANNEGTIGSPLRKWLSIYAAELNIDVFTYAETLATSGGHWLIAPSTALIEDISDSATTIKVKSNNIANGDILYLSNNGRVEYMTATSTFTRINKAGIGNLSAETGTTSWATSGVATLTSSVEQHWHGGKSLKWAYTSGTANITFTPASMLANSTAYMVSIYVKRADGAAVIPVAGGAYRLYVDAQNGVLCNASVQDVGNGWYRLFCTGTTAGASAAGVGVQSIPTTTNHYFDAVQVETGAALTAWSRDSASYTVTRNGDATGADVWEAGTGIVNTRQTGAGMIDCYATQGFHLSTAIGPTCSFLVRTSSTYNALAPRSVIGNLNGLYGYATDTYGAAFGDPTDENITIEPLNGFRLRTGTTTVMQLTGTSLTLANGNLALDTNGIVLTPPTGYTSTRGYTFNHGGSFLAGMHFYRDTSVAFIDSLSIDNTTTTNSTAVLQLSNAVSGGPLASLQFQSDATTGTAQLSIKNRYIINEPTATRSFNFSLDNSLPPGGSGPWFRTDGSYLVISPKAASDLYLAWDNGATVQVGAPSFFRGGLFPITSNTYDLGSAALRWNNIYFNEPTTAAALFPLVSNSGQIMAKNDGINATFSIGGTCSVTYEYGILTAHSGAGCP